MAQKKQWTHFFVKLFKNLDAHDTGVFAGFISFQTLLSFFPFTIVFVFFLSLFGAGRVLQDHYDYIFTSLPGPVRDTLLPALTRPVDETGIISVVISVIVAIVVTSDGVEALRVGLNRAYGIRELRPFIPRRLQSILFVIGFAVTFWLAAIAIIILPALQETLKAQFGSTLTLTVGWHIVRFALTILILTGMLIILYRALPNTVQGFKTILPGALFAAVTWTVMAGFFSFYLQYFANYDKIYGGIAGIAITLIFFQLSSFIILIGGEINALFLSHICNGKAVEQQQQPQP